MIVYWAIFGFATLMSLRYRSSLQHDGRQRAVETLWLVVFALLYVCVGGFRYEVGGDWVSYGWMYTQISFGSLRAALTYTDPLFGLLNWISAQFGMGVYPVNAIVCAILVTGVIRLASIMRDRWLAILISVPYLLIVIGMGYLRQAAAIGFILLALYSLEKNRKLRSVVYLALAAGFHATSVVVLPLFVASISRRFLAYAIIILALSAFAYFAFLDPRLEFFEAHYLEAGYDSTGAFVRLLMGFLPALVLLLRWRHFELRGPSRPVWFLFALGAIALFAAYFISPSSTAVDRVGLYFSVVQIAVFGELLNLFNFKRREVIYVRVAAIAVAIAIQVVWLFFAVHASRWVPYHSILEFT
jgi:hypothetical protein